MKCDYTFCCVTHTDPYLNCIWCNRHFHKQCLLSVRYDPDILFEKNSNIQCTFCNPNIPFRLAKDNITIHRYGKYVISSFELTKPPSERKFIYPIGFCSSRCFPSYKKSNENTVIYCEILCVDEKYLEDNSTGEKDDYLFKVTFQDDPDNPIEVIHSLRLLATKINERFNCKKMNTSATKLFGLDNIYVQYLISVHVPNAQEISLNSSETLLQQMYDNDNIDKCIFTTCKDVRPEKFLYSVNNKMLLRNKKSFDPQKHMFNF